MKFVLLGNGPELQKLKTFVEKMHLTENIIFKGWIDRNEIPRYLAESAIGIGPLRVTDVTKRALPIKVLEYMSSSLPILAVNGTLPDDVLKNGENGFFVSNSKELSQTIIQLLEIDELRLKMGKKSRQMVTKFDWQKVAESIIHEYNTITSSSK